MLWYKYYKWQNYYIFCWLSKYKEVSALQLCDSTVVVCTMEVSIMVVLLWYDGMTVWRYDGMTVWQYYGMIVWRYDGMTVWRYDGMTVWRYDSMTVLRYDGITVLY